MLDKTHDNHRKRDDDPEKNCKRSVSFRIDEADFEKIKAIARRMRTRESDVFRFAIRMTLNKLSLLSDESIKGIDVMPVFVECGADIALHFNLDSNRIEHIINYNLPDHAQRVDDEDIGLLALASMPERYLSAKLKHLVDLPIEKIGVSEALREYLNKKYLEQYSGTG